MHRHRRLLFSGASNKEPHTEGEREAVKTAVMSWASTTSADILILSPRKRHLHLTGR